MKQIIVHKGRTVILPISFGFDISDDVITSEIREEKNRESELIAAWAFSFLTDGTDGEAILTLDNTITDDITQSSGYMDLKRITAGEPISVFDDPLEVLFKNPITV